MESLDPQFVEAYRARNLPEAHMIRIALEEAGIPAQIEGELLQGAVGDLPIGWPTAPRIVVAESQVDAARQISRRSNRDHALPGLRHADGRVQSEMPGVRMVLSRVG
jgi:hypothetical protein